MNILQIHKQILMSLKQRRTQLSPPIPFYVDIVCSAAFFILLKHVYEREKIRYRHLFFLSDFYLLDVLPLIKAYRKDINIPIKKTFGSQVTSSLPKIEETYFTLASNYTTDISSLATTTRAFSGEELENAKVSHGDSARVNIFSKYSYENRSHFLNCINQYQGKQRCLIEEALLENMKKELFKYKLVDIRANGNISYDRVKKKHIKILLKELGATKKHNENINLIYHKITGKPLDDISYLTEKLLSDFDLFNKEFHLHYSAERRNFNYKNLLFQLLQKHGHSCDRSDFNFLKTTERRVYHDDICRNIFAELGWNYKPLF